MSWLLNFLFRTPLLCNWLIGLTLISWLTLSLVNRGPVRRMRGLVLVVCCRNLFKLRCRVRRLRVLLIGFEVYVLFLLFVRDNK